MKLMRSLLMAATYGVAAIVIGQQPFDLDQEFVTNIQQRGVSSIAVLDDGDLLVSGDIHFGGSLEGWLLARLDPDGTRDTNWPDVSPPGGGKLVPWVDRYYVGVGQRVLRVWPNGLTDYSFHEFEDDPYIHVLQGGDYHVFPDGRLLITGTHELTDTARGFNGLYNLIWITADGRLDTTRVHRRGNGDLSKMRELLDGSFIIGGGMTEFEGHPVGNIIRVFADGALDTTFFTTASWFYPANYLPLADGKVICVGDVVFSGNDDTLHVFRLLPDGSLDPTFNNNLALWRTYDLDGKAVVSSIAPLGPDRYIVTGGFDRVEGQFRGGIAVIDTAGYLLDEPLGEAGCGTFWNGFYTTGLIVGIVPAPEYGYYIYGAYHGYDDGTIDDESQRMVSRLYGLDVGVREPYAVLPALEVYPNPASTTFNIRLDNSWRATSLVVEDIAGRTILERTVPKGFSVPEVDITGLSTGIYQVRVSDGAGRSVVGKLMKE